MHRLIVAGVLGFSLSNPAALRAQDTSALFWDDFEDDIGSSWIIQGENFGMVNNQLASQGQLTAYVGDTNWVNYAVEFDLIDLAYKSDLRVLIRRQSGIDYMSWHLYREYRNTCAAKLVLVREGIEQEIVISHSDIETRNTGCPGHYKIEVNGNTYRAFKDGSNKIVFTNTAFSSGNVGLFAMDDRTGFIIDNFKVTASP